MLFQHSQLIQRGAVKNHVCMLLIGENPAFFAALDGFPHGYRSLDRGASGFIIPDNSPQEAQIAGGDTVVVVQIQGKQGADIELEDFLFVHTLGNHLGIQAVNSLYNDDRILTQGKLPVVPYPPSCGKVKAGQRRGVPRQQAGNVLPEHLCVQRVDVLQIHRSIRPWKDFIPVDIIVIQAHENRLFPVDTELGCQAVGRGGLSGGAGPCQHHHLGIPLADHVRNLRNPLLVKGLVDTNQLMDAAGNRLLVQVGHGLAFHQGAPALSLRENREEIGAGLEFGGTLRGKVVRIQENHAALCRNQIPNRQISGGRQHLPKEIVGKILVDVFVKEILVEPLQQLRLIGLVISAELFDGLLPGESSANQGEILGYIFAYLSLQGIHGKILCIFYAEVDAVAHGAADFGNRIRPKGTNCQKYQEARRPGIHLLPHPVGIAKQMDFPMGGRHGPANGGTVVLMVGHPDRNIVQGENLTRNFCCQWALF